jgi:hypothetical protein
MASRAAGIFAILGAILLIASLFVIYYSDTVSASGGGYSFSGEQAYFLNDKMESSFSGSTNTQTYSAAGENNTGNLYNVVTYLTYGGIVLGLIGAVLAFMGRSGTARLVLVLALILAIVGPLILLAEQPAAVSADYKNSTGSSPSGSGPWSSFYGSCSNSACGSAAGVANTSGVSNSQSWGPGLGWYLAIVAFVFFLIGMVMAGGRRMAAATPAPEPAPMSTTETTTTTADTSGSSPPSTSMRSRSGTGRPSAVAAVG